MTHRICTADADVVLAYFQRLWRTLLVPDIEPRTRLELLFEHETDEFDLQYAFASSIDLEDETERFETVYGSHEVLRPDATVPLSRTYCRKTITDPEGTMAVSDAAAEGWDDDPAYETFELGSYIGTTVTVDDELYGTLCFADSAARTESFRDREKALLEMYGQWVAYVLASWDESPIRQTRTDTVEGRAVSPDAIDSMMDALKSRARRSVLVALSANPTEASIETIEERVGQDSDRMQLYHSHLPRLASAGYITWDTDADTISRGPEFSEVAPLVHLLRAYETETTE